MSVNLCKNLKNWFFPLLVVLIAAIATIITWSVRPSKSDPTSKTIVLANYTYPRIENGDECRSLFSGIWVLTEDSLRTVRDEFGSRDSTRESVTEIDSHFLLMTFSGAKSVYLSDKDKYIGISDTRYFQRGQNVMSSVYASPNSPGPQLGLCAQMFVWNVTNNGADLVTNWPERDKIRTWLIQSHEEAPDQWETHVFAVLKRDQKLVLRKISPFRSEGNVSYLEWVKLD